MVKEGTPLEAKQLHHEVQAILETRYDGNQRLLSQDVGLSPSTISRTLNLSNDYGLKSRISNLRQIIREAGEMTDAEWSSYNQNVEAGQSSRIAEPKEQKYTLSTQTGLGLPILRIRASAGDGSYVTEEEEQGRYVVDPQELKSLSEGKLGKNGYFVVVVEGDSMKPEFHPGEMVVMKAVTPDRLIPIDGVYLYRHEDMIQLKRLQRRGGRVIHVISANDRYPSYTIELDDGTDFELLGRVYARFERYS